MKKFVIAALFLFCTAGSCESTLISSEPATVLEVRTVGGARTRVIQDPAGNAAGGAALGYVIGGGVGAIMGAGMAAEDSSRSLNQGGTSLDACTVILELKGGEKRTLYSNTRYEYIKTGDPQVTRCASLWPGDKVFLELRKDYNDKKFWFVRMEGE